MAGLVAARPGAVTGMRLEVAGGALLRYASAMILPTISLIAAALAAQASPAASGDWIRVASGEQATFLVDRSSLSRRGERARFRVRVIARRPRGEIASVLADAELDCASRTSIVHAAAFFGSGGARVRGPAMAAGAAYGIPADIPEAVQLYERVCRSLRAQRERG